MSVPYVFPTTTFFTDTLNNPDKVVGPYYSSGGNAYVFGRDGTTGTTLQVQKCTGSPVVNNFSSVATQTGFSTAILGVNAVQVGDVIHLIVSDGTDSSSVNYKYRTFDMATDAFVTSETIISALNLQGANPVRNTNLAHAAITVRSDASVVVCFIGLHLKTSGNFQCRAYYSRRTGVNTWIAAVQIDASGTNDSLGPMRAQLGASDRTHFFWFQTDGGAQQLKQRVLTSANALQTVGGISTNSPPGWSISYASGANTIVFFGEAGTNQSFGSFTSGDTPTITTHSFPGTNYGAGSPISPGQARYDGTDVYLFGLQAYKIGVDPRCLSGAPVITDDGASGGSHTGTYRQVAAARVQWTDGHLANGTETMFTRNDVLTYGHVYVGSLNGVWTYDEYPRVPIEKENLITVVKQTLIRSNFW